MRLFMIAVLALGVGGCSVPNKQERIELAKAGVALAAEQLSGPIAEILVEEGIDEATAKKVREIVIKRARALADKVISKLED